jgi:hypothetical protein
MSGEWVHLVALGRFGDVEFDDDAIAELVRNFRGPVPMGAPRAPPRWVGLTCLGWIDRVERRSDGLWGHLEWSADALPFPRRPRSYASAAIRINSRDRTTGDRIGSVLVSASPTPCPLSKVAPMKGPKP